jgi:hypothetical protein
MFADSVLDSAWANCSHRGWTTFVAFTAQALGLGVFFLLPELRQKYFLVA